jgi:hypothetical protein
MINKNNFDATIGDHKLVRDKFIETEDGFYNERLMEEIIKRKKKSSNLTANALKRWELEKQKQCNCIAIALQGDMPTENENENVIINKDIVINTPNIKRTIEKQTEEFKNELVNYKCIYPSEILRSFFMYWSEPNISKTKIRKEMQKTWDTKRRLEYWSCNGKEKGNSPTVRKFAKGSTSIADIEAGLDKAFGKSQDGETLF